MREGRLAGLRTGISMLHFTFVHFLGMFQEGQTGEMYTPLPHHCGATPFPRFPSSPGPQSKILYFSEGGTAFTTTRPS